MEQSDPEELKKVRGREIKSGKTEKQRSWEIMVLSPYL